jgi:hypothetical protein
MNDRTTHALRRALLGVTCAVGCASLALAGPTPKPPASSDSFDNPATFGKKQASRTTRSTRAAISGGGEGGIAGATLLFDNGPIDTGEAVCTGTRSTIQNTTPICLTNAGFNNTAFKALDDFTLPSCAEINRVTVYMYLTNATTITITGGEVTLHSGKPWGTTSNVIATSTTPAEPPSLTTTWRAATTACNRQVQQLVLDTSSWPVLPAGTYWLSWRITSTGGGFCPPVTILGLQGKPGANGELTAATTFPSVFGNPMYDAGVAGCVGQPAPPGVRQELPFLLHGVLGGCGPCSGDTDGDSDVDADDLTNVILQWGSTCPCTGDVDDDNDVDSDDLTLVILGWGPCGGPPVPPVSTGGCCVGGNCSVMTFQACESAGGTYIGDGTDCAFGCSAPANDDCTGAIPAVTGNNTVNTTFATNGGPAVLPCDVPPTTAPEISRDVWLSLASVNGQQYTVTTTNTPAGLGNVADTVLVVYSGPDCSNLTQVVCNDDIAAVGGPSTVVFNGTGGTMWIRVGTWVAAQPTVAPGGNIVVTVSSP